MNDNFFLKTTGLVYGSLGSSKNADVFQAENFSEFNKKVSVDAKSCYLLKRFSHGIYIN